MLELDGSFGEGGGQILRTSLSLSLVTGKAFRLRNIRAGRSKPGLQPQHLMSVRAAAEVGQAAVSGAALGSTELSFEPGEVRPGRYTFDIRTAGATGLVLHTLYLPLAYRAGVPSELTLKGGTHVTASPCFHFLDGTWRAYMELLGLRIKLNMFRSGFYPRGGGVVDVVIQPCPFLLGFNGQSITKPTKASIVSVTASLPEHIRRRQSRRIEYRLRESGLKLSVEEEQWEGGPGTVVLVSLDTQPVPTIFFGLGALRKPAENVADEAADQVLEYLAGEPAVDSHSADQLLLPLSLADGPSIFSTCSVSSHLTTNSSVIQRFVERKIEVSGDEGKPGIVRIHS